MHIFYFISFEHILRIISYFKATLKTISLSRLYIIYYIDIDSIYYIDIDSIYCIDIDRNMVFYLDSIFYLDNIYCILYR